MLKAMPEDIQMEAVIDVMVAEASKTSAIEGEYLTLLINVFDIKSLSVTLSTMIFLDFKRGM